MNSKNDKTQHTFIMPPPPPAAFLQMPKSSRASRSLPCSRPASLDSATSELDVDTMSGSSDENNGRIMFDVNKLPPIGVFWDIENCHVPRGKSAVAVAQAIRDRFFDGYREAEFLVVCDVTKENAKIIQELNDAHVSLLHVAATCKNAADDKLRQSIRKFADIHLTPAAIILISGDINFSSDLYDLRHRKKLHIILLHNSHASEALLFSANEYYNFAQLMEAVPLRGNVKEGNLSVELPISNLPTDLDPSKVKGRLKQLCDNSGGRVGFVNHSTCSIWFPTIEFAVRAHKRMDGEDVFGRKISVGEPIRTDEILNHTRYRKESTRNQWSKEEAEPFSQRAQKESNLHFNNYKFCVPKPKEEGCYDAEYPPLTSPHSFNQFAKATVPSFANNISKFSFPKIPNVENLRVPNSGVVEQRNLTQKPFNNDFQSGIYAPGPSGTVTMLTSSCKQEISMMRNNFTNLNSPEPSYRLNNFDLMEQQNITQEPSCSSSLKVVNHGISHGVDFTSRNGGCSESPRVLSEYQCDDITDEAFFQPIQNEGKGIENQQPVELHISGLDPAIDIITTKNTLGKIFQIHVDVLNVSVFNLTDGSVVAAVRVPSMQDAQYAISQLQRYMIGSRRINIAFQNATPHRRELLRSQVNQLLSEIPSRSLPLFVFLDRFKCRYLNPVSVSELTRMRDICLITGDKSGRMIMANSVSRGESPSKQTQARQDHEAFCIHHTRKTWSDTKPPVLPNVNLDLKTLGERIPNLLQAHDGRLPLPSLADCYQAYFGPLPVDSEGVPIEHLVTWVPNVKISQSQGGFKYVSLVQNINDDKEVVHCVSPMLAGNLAFFAKKLVELIQDTPKCMLPFSQFIPTFHRRYGKQCRVSDYGFTKLIDLLESVPHVIQVLGHGSQKIIMLSHKAQIRRFSGDLIRVLKQQSEKQLNLNDIPLEFENLLQRKWNPSDYGVCEISDLLDCLPSNTVTIKEQNGQIYVSLVTRDQTPQEEMLTKEFAVEVVVLLKQEPSCSMTFNKFVPAYHNFFGRQCRVTSYGFTRLVDLFEAIPETVVLENESSCAEKSIVLTLKERLRVLGERILSIIQGQKCNVPLSQLQKLYAWHMYGAVLAPEDFGCETLEELIMKLSNYITLQMTPFGPVVVTNKYLDPLYLTQRARRILQRNRSMTAADFTAIYKQLFDHEIDLDFVAALIPETIVVTRGKYPGEATVHLTPLSMFANQLLSLIVEHGGRLPLHTFESAYTAKFKYECQPNNFGHSTLSALLNAVSDVAYIENNGNYPGERTLILSRDLLAASSTPSSRQSPKEKINDGGSSFVTYDMWQGKALFPQNMPVSPHPSELPFPSNSLASPSSARLLSALAPVTSTTDDEETGYEGTHLAKRKNRLAANLDKFGRR